MYIVRKNAAVVQCLSSCDNQISELKTDVVDLDQLMPPYHTFSENSHCLEIFVQNFCFG